MNRPIRRVGYAVTVLILLLVAQLTYLQVVDADNLANDPKNVRKQLKDYNRARGEILTADGQIVAQSRPHDRRLQVRRASTRRAACSRTPRATSRSSTWWAASGVEESYNKVLTGRTPACS